MLINWAPTRVFLFIYMHIEMWSAAANLKMKDSLKYLIIR